MSIPREEARETLQGIQQTERNSKKLHGYRQASPHLILWGIIWVIGYGGTYLNSQWARAWPVLTLVGVVGSIVIARRMAPGRPRDWRRPATGFTIFAFINAFFAVAGPLSALTVSATIPLWVAFIYVLFGIWTRSTRLLVTGAVLGTLVVAGFFALPQYFQLWMAAVGGGGLILGGIWMRSL
ncbi:MAG TPA: hypothetical protein VNF49_11525 [Candidatus Binataceae bacterium]|nr:hypothetical protein [Candidatus Binataceae bacterium]